MLCCSLMRLALKSHALACISISVCLAENVEQPPELSGSMRNPEGGIGGPDTIPENHKTIGFLRNTGLDPQKLTKLPSQH